MFAEQKYLEVVQCLHREWSVFQQFPRAYSLLVSALERLGHHQDAYAISQALLKRFPNEQDPALHAADYLMRRGYLQTGVDVLTRFITPESTDYKALIKIARGFYQLGQHREAFNYVKHLPPHCLNEVSNALIIAVIHYELGQYEQALSLLEKARKQQPRNFFVLNNLGNVKRKLRKFEECIADYEQALPLAGNNAVVVLRNLAAVNWLLSRLPQADSFFSRALSLAPFDGLTHEDYFKFKWAVDKDNAFTALEGAGQRSDCPAYLKVLYARLLVQSQRLIDAEAVIERLSSQMTVQQQVELDVLPLYCRVLRELGKHNKVIELTDANEQIPSTKLPTLWFERANALTLLNRHDEAYHFIERAINAVPANLGYWALKVSIIQRMGDEPSYRALMDYDRFVYPCKVSNNKEQLAALLEEVKQYLFDVHQHTGEPFGQSVALGKQTYDDVFESEHPSIQQLATLILSNARDYCDRLAAQPHHPLLGRIGSECMFSGSWSVLLSKNGYHKSHYHPDGWISGVLYVDVAEDALKEGAGWLQFGRCDLSGQLGEADYLVKPESGLMVLFPSYFWHGTEPMTSDSTRLTIAFDLVPRNS